MCGILGIAFQNGCTLTNRALIRSVLLSLLEESEIWGMDATGVAFVNKNEIAVLKSPMSASEFRETAAFKEAIERYICLQGHLGTISVIGHCRAKTKGSELDNNNNHPIVTKNIVGIHNGIIYNDEKLFSRFQAYSRKFERRGEVDSEIIFQMIDYLSTENNANTKDAIRRTAAQALDGSFACAMVERKNPYLLWLFRASGPISLVHFHQKGLLLFASTESTISNIMTDTMKKKLGKYRFINLFPHQGVCINLFSNTLSRFSTKVESWKELRAK